MAKNKNKSFDRGKQFLLIAVILLLLGAVLLLSETPKKGTISNIVEEPSVVTNVELVGKIDIKEPIIVVEEKEEIVIEAGILEYEVIQNKPEDATSLVRRYFNTYNNKEFAVACDIISDTKCNAKNAGDVNRFGQEYNKMTDGYENLVLWSVDTADFHSNVVCVEYDYRYDISSDIILHETMSFYVQNGKIISRVCENKTANGEEIDCPILSRKDFCL